ncbi:hypothetical protein TeGR_g12670 [Tetraparma gracilis]|uniref:Uncharacterized protein n=1 Tax=Tetraparma gracilis TaxID=2962635 RepID=A0ABQ6MI23_9STRA|nr:hypothetical protein TeGR_g12670 [Tetraparma gracilis]
MLVRLQMLARLLLVGALCCCLLPTPCLSLAPYSVIGPGRIGSLLASLAPSAPLLGRGADLSSLPPGPIYLATRNAALPAVLSAVPAARRADLVFLQNGHLAPYLSSQSLSGNTQALLYLAVPSLSAAPVDGVTAASPEGLTAATGVHAGHLRELLALAGMRCRVLRAAEYERAMFEKLMWISALMLVGTAKGCASVGAAQREHGGLLDELLREMCEAVEEAEGVELGSRPELLARLRAYTDKVAGFPCAVKEYEWRNEYFSRRGCPVHQRLLGDCVRRGEFAFPVV